MKQIFGMLIISVIIGLLHPVVMKAEYYIGTKVWPMFLLSGLACIVGSLFCVHDTAASLVMLLNGMGIEAGYLPA